MSNFSPIAYVYGYALMIYSIVLYHWEIKLYMYLFPFSFMEKNKEQDRNIRMYFHSMSTEFKKFLREKADLQHDIWIGKVFPVLRYLLHMKMLLHIHFHTDDEGETMLSA